MEEFFTTIEEPSKNRGAFFCTKIWTNQQPNIQIIGPGAHGFWRHSTTLWLCQNSYGKSPFLMGKSTISMAIFNSYVSLPEGSHLPISDGHRSTFLCINRIFSVIDFGMSSALCVAQI